MRADLTILYNEGIANLKDWRERYSKNTYPEKVVINIFYRKVTMEILFSAILGCFEILAGKHKFTWNGFEEGFTFLNNAYSNIAVEKTQKLLPIILKERTEFNFGNINYETFIPQIEEASMGDNKQLEAIEFAYLYYFLTDQSILLWGAFGGTGLSKIDSIAKITGAIIEASEIKSYAQIENILGRLCVAPFLHNIYKALPPNS